MNAHTKLFKPMTTAIDMWKSELIAMNASTDLRPPKIKDPESQERLSPMISHVIL
jgi:hypothetical protein